ncbi:DNA helicase RecQ [Campylobacter sp. MIT 12-8780]|nr:DNA helicase RecQ [Campylobacter sp. MIT 12-8780]
MLRSYNKEQLLSLLKKHFSYTSFRKGQFELMSEILAQRDVLALMPTSAGKSLCFQLPALALDGLSLVITPLNSLMQDQVLELRSKNIPAFCINSTQDLSQNEAVFKELRKARVKLLYVSPERLQNEAFLNFIKKQKIAQIAVDEAHCISAWGQDFRPSYLQIADFIEKLGQKVVVSAFTATATPLIREDIISALRLKNPFILSSGFHRENLYLELFKGSLKQKFAKLFAFLQDFKGQNGIVYCMTRKITDELHKRLYIEGFKCEKYHAGMEADERLRAQESFMQGKTRIMVATNAFGMGINKKDIRFIVHFNLPKNLEHYYQEIGRAGRDGLKSSCLLLFNEGDIMMNKKLICTDDKDEKLIQNELKLLEAMQGFAFHKECLKAYILAYFGEDLTQNCDCCINCKSEFELQDISIEAQKILSCIIRMNEGFGISFVSEILRGISSQRAVNLGFDKLSTFALMKEKSKAELDTLIKELLTLKLLEQSKDKYPVLKTLPKAKKVLFNNEKVFLKTRLEDKEHMLEKESKIPKSKAHSFELESKDEALFLELKKLRLKLAQHENKKAFMIFSDKSLISMCKLKPQNELEFKAVFGVGEEKFKNYAKDFLSLISKVGYE